ncbi:MAG: sulfatase-like hydrolase/transferase [Bryobacterales bacterium]|nr:sulfatase-like hydrolase/transferase [Bryobacterales bacterium]
MPPDSIGQSHLPPSRPVRRTFLAAGLGLAAAPALLRAASARPNVLWIMTDEQRPDSVGCYGSPWARTPHLDALAAQGSIFTSTYVPAPVCVACRSALLTGKRASSIGVLHNQARLRDDTTFLPWRFADTGYQTASFGKKHYFVKGRQAFQTEAGAADDKHVNGTRYLQSHKPEDWNALIYESRAANGLRRSWILAGEFPAPEEECAERVNAQLAMDWLAARDSSKPFFLRLSLNAPHTPVVMPRRFVNTVDAGAVQLTLPTEAQLNGQPAREREALRPFQGTSHLSLDAIRRLRQAYYARVAFLDDVVGGFLDWMRTRGLLENTIVAFMSDHGTHIADQGMLQKQTFYEQVGTVPFFVAWPGNLPAGRRITQPVNVGSLMATFLHLAGLPTVGSHYPSLAPALRGHAPAPAEPVFSELAYGYQGYRDHHRQVMIRDGRHKLVLFQDPKDPRRFHGNEDGALYDLEVDPQETRNLFRLSASQPHIQRLRQSIRAWDQRLA